MSLEDDNLCDKNDVVLGLANTAAAVIADKSEASDAGGANILVATSTVCHPLQAFRTNRAAIVHLRYRIVYEETNLGFAGPKFQNPEMKLGRGRW